MVFPNDIYKKMQNQSKIAGDNQTQLVITVTVVLNVFGFIGLRWLLYTFLDASLGVVIIVQVILNLLIGTAVFRYIIFDEDTKRREYNEGENDSFAKYMYLRKDVAYHSEARNKTLHVFEFANGCATCTMEFRFGGNDDAKARASREALNKIMGLALSFGFECRVVDDTEDFKTSQEFKRHVAGVNAIEDVRLRNTMMRVTDSILEECYEVCNVDVLYLTLKAASNYQREELESLMRSVLSVLEDSMHAFRSVKFLDVNELLEFYRNFYKIAAIDLAMMRAVEMSKSLDEDFASVVSIYAVVSADGKYYRLNSGGSQGYFRLHERRIND